MSKFCSKCGNELMDGAPFCPRCGCATGNTGNGTQFNNGGNINGGFKIAEEGQAPPMWTAEQAAERAVKRKS